MKMSSAWGLYLSQPLCKFVFLQNLPGGINSVTRGRVKKKKLTQTSMEGATDLNAAQSLHAIINTLLSGGFKPELCVVVCPVMMDFKHVLS